MKFPKGEEGIGHINARRKGKAGGYQAPCTIGVSHLENDPGVIVLRAVDANGVPPLVALLNPEQAQELARLLIS